MTDNRDSVPGSDGSGGGGVVPPPFPNAAPPAPPAPYPAPYPAAPARGAPWGWIVAAILAAALIILLCLYFFTSLLDKAPRDSWDNGGSSFSQSGSGSGSGALGSSGSSAGTGSGQGTYAPPPPPPTTTNPVAGYAPTAAWLQGTWGPGCPGSSAQAIALYEGGRLVAQGGEGSWSLDGDIVTLTGNGRTLVTRWEYLSQDMARVTQTANGRVETVRRCP
ncbi:MAG TPA: hypothetical protein VGO55_14390 [Allosphingosinicella sp.]|jgi:hypothetical protein|nr:hypothetical protein [Allosphingosinicella sp.]